MKGLSVHLKKKVNGFHLNVQWSIENELAVLFGYSGSGKSMTLQMIAGLMEPDEGIVTCNGKVLFDSSSKKNIHAYQRQFGYVFQELALFPHMSVKENILYGAHGLHKSDAQKKVREIMSICKIEFLEDKYPFEISGGQKQRTALARALIRMPDALLLDEPFSSLDSPLRIEMRNFLIEIRKQFKIPVVLVTHDILEAYSMADRMIVYAGGRVIQSGIPSEVLRNPANAEVSMLIDTTTLYQNLNFLNKDSGNHPS